MEVTEGTKLQILFESFVRFENLAIESSLSIESVNAKMISALDVLFFQTEHKKHRKSRGAIRQSFCSFITVGIISLIGTIINSIINCMQIPFPHCGM